MTGTDTPGIRGATGSGDVHVVAFRPADSTQIWQATGTPLSQPVSVACNALFGSSPWVYRRHDGVTAVLYLDTSRHVHEISANDGNLDFFNAFQPSVPRAAAAPPGGPAPDVIGYVRTDNRSAVVYRSVDNHVIELLSNFGGQPAWLATDVTVAAGTSLTATDGSPFPFVRTDGWNSIPYIASDNHIHELATRADGLWGDWDISAQTGDTVVPATEPWAYVRSDGWNTIVFVGADGAMREFGLQTGGSHWGSWFITAAVSPLTGPYRRPSGFVRPDGVNAIVYLSNDQSIHQLKLGNQGWLDSVVSTGSITPVGPLFGHLARTRSSLLFHGRDAGILRRYEFSQTATSPWTQQAF